MIIKVNESSHGGYTVQVGVERKEAVENPLGTGYIMPGFTVYRSSHCDTRAEVRREIAYLRKEYDVEEVRA